MLSGWGGWGGVAGHPFVLVMEQPLCLSGIHCTTWHSPAFLDIRVRLSYNNPWYHLTLWRLVSIQPQDWDSIQPMSPGSRILCELMATTFAFMTLTPQNCPAQLCKTSLAGWSRWRASLVSDPFHHHYHVDNILSQKSWLYIPSVCKGLAQTHHMSSALLTSRKSCNTMSQDRFVFNKFNYNPKTNSSLS